MPPAAPRTGFPKTITLLVAIAFFQVAHLVQTHAPWDTASCSTLGGAACTSANCTCPLGLRLQRLLAHDGQICFRSDDAKLCPNVGEQSCSMSACECKEPAWLKIYGRLETQPCWQCTAPTLLDRVDEPGDMKPSIWRSTAESDQSVCRSLSATSPRASQAEARLTADGEVSTFITLVFIAFIVATMISFSLCGCNCAAFSSCRIQIRRRVSQGLRTVSDQASEEFEDTLEALTESLERFSKSLQRLRQRVPCFRRRQSQSQDVPCTVAPKNVQPASNDGEYNRTSVLSKTEIALASPMTKLECQLEAETVASDMSSETCNADSIKVEPRRVEDSKEDVMENSVDVVLDQAEMSSMAMTQFQKVDAAFIHARSITSEFRVPCEGVAIRVRGTFIEAMELGSEEDVQSSQRTRSKSEGDLRSWFPEWE